MTDTPRHIGSTESTGDNHPKEQLDLETEQQVDHLCDEYEARFRAGGGLDLKTFIQRACAGWSSAAKTHAVREVVALDRELRRKSDQAGREYAVIFPDEQAALRDAAAIDEQSQAEEREPADRNAADLAPGDGGRGPSVIMVSEDSTPSNWNNPSSVPKRLGPYQIKRMIGKGGMGVVFEAEHVSMKKRVALKTLNAASVLDQRGLQRFKNEAHAASRLDHKHIVPVTDIDSDKGVHYYVMKYIEGANLSDVIRRMRNESKREPGQSSPAAAPNADLFAETGPVDADQSHTPAGRASSTSQSIQALASTRRTGRDTRFFRVFAKLGAQVAEALHHAHERGVVHRDIKPSNLLLDERGDLWVADFGLAQMNDAPGVTLTGDFVGTLRYMSPEQALANRVTVDHRTDVYSLGVTLYEFLTLQQAYDGRSRAEVLRQISFQDPMKPRRINNHIPVDLETIVVKALAKNPDERYQSAKELAEDLVHFSNNEPIVARPPTLAERGWKWVQRHRALVATAAAFITLIASFSSFAAVVYRNQRDAEAERRVEVEALLQQSEGHRLAALSMLETIKQGPGVGVMLAYEGRKKHESLVTNNALREALDQNHELRTIPLGSDRVGSLAINPTGDKIVVTAAKSNDKMTAQIWDLKSGKRLATLLSDKSIRSAVFSPMGVRVLTQTSSFDRRKQELTDGVVELWHAVNGKPLQTLNGARMGRVTPASFSPDGDWVVSPSEGNTATIYRVSDGAKVRVLNGHAKAVFFAAFSPTGENVVTVSADRSVKVWSKEGKLQHSLPASSWPAETPEEAIFSADGRMLCTRTQQHSVDLWDVGSGQRVNAAKWYGQHVGFSADSRLLLVANRFGKTIHAYGAKSAELQWETKATSGKEGSIDLLATPRSNASARVSPLIAIGVGKDIQLRRAADGGLAATLRGHATTVRMVELSADGTDRLASIGNDQTVRIWSTRSGAQRVAFTINPPTQPDVVFAQHGTRIAIAAPKASKVRIYDSRPAGKDHIARFNWSGVADDYQSRYAIVRDNDMATIRDVARNRAIATFAPNVGRLHRCWLSKDASTAFIVADNDESSNWIWRPEAQRKIKLTKPAQRIVDADFSPEGAILAVGESDGAVRILDVRSGKPVQVLQVKHGCEDIRFSPDGKHVVVSGDQNVASVIQLSDQSIREFGGGDTPPFSRTKFTPNGEYLVAWHRHRNERVRILEFASLKEVGPSVPMNGVVDVEVDEQNAQFLVAGSTGVYAARVDDQKPIRLSPVRAAAVVFTDNGTRAAAVIAPIDPNHPSKRLGRYLLATFDLATGKLEQQAKLPPGNYVDMHSGDVEIDGESRPSVLISTNEYGIDVFEKDDNRAVASIIGHGNFITWLGFTSDGGQIVTTALDHSAAVWDAKSGRLIHWFEGHVDSIMDAEFNEDTSLVATAGRDGMVHVWETATGKAAYSLEVGEEVAQIDFVAKSNAWMTRSRNGNLSLWDQKGESLKVPWRDKYVLARTRRGQILALPVGRNWPPPPNPLMVYLRVLYPGTNILQWRKSATSDPVELKHKNSLVFADFDPASNRCVTVDTSGKTYVWRLSEQPKIEIEFQLEPKATAAHFSPDGTFLLVRQEAGATLIRADDGTQLVEFPHIPGRLADYRKSPFSIGGQSVIEYDESRSLFRTYAISILESAEDLLPLRQELPNY